MTYEMQNTYRINVPYINLYNLIIIIYNTVNTNVTIHVKQQQVYILSYIY